MMLCLPSPSPADSGNIPDAPPTRDVTAANAAYQYIVPDMELNGEGEIAFYDMIHILSGLFSVPQKDMNIYSNSAVRHTVLMDLLRIHCGMDIALIERDYAAETEYVTYEQFFDVLDYFYLDILEKHGMTLKTANAYQLSGRTRLAFDDGELKVLENVSLSDGRVTVTYDKDTIVAVSPLELPYLLNLSSVREMWPVRGSLYYYSEQEGILLLQTQDGIKRYEISGNPLCFAKNGTIQKKINETMLDKTVTLYLTNYKKVPNVVVMLIDPA